MANAARQTCKIKRIGCHLRSSWNSMSRCIIEGRMWLSFVCEQLYRRPRQLFTNGEHQIRGPIIQSLIRIAWTLLPHPRHSCLSYRGLGLDIELSAFGYRETSTPTKETYLVDTTRTQETEECEVLIRNLLHFGAGISRHLFSSVLSNILHPLCGSAHQHLGLDNSFAIQ